MKRAFKIIAVTTLILAVLISGTVFVIARSAVRSPEKVTQAVKHQLARHFPLPISLARARFEWKQGPRVILTNVEINSPGAITLKVKSVTAYLTFWRLVLGEVSIKKLRLVEPSGTLDIEGLRRLAIDRKTGERPVVIVWKGTITCIYKGIDIPLKDLSGRVTKDWINLRAWTLGGRVLLQADLVKPGKVTFDAYGIPLGQLDPAFKGMANASLALEDVNDAKSGSFSFQAKNLGLPCIRGTIPKVVASAALSGNGHRMIASDISIKTPMAEITGRADIAGMEDFGNWKNSVLSVDASSKEFDYEKVVSVLPTHRFPDWLRDLLTKQIREGRSRFLAARYKGTIQDLSSGTALMDNLHVVQELRGQSFSAGYAPEKITGITGQVIYSKGDIRFSNISGMMGQSRLKRVDIVFPGAVKPLMRVGVDVDLDMSAADFIRAWHAAMVPPEVYRLLTPVSSVKAGQVKAQVNTYYDEERKNPFMCRGTVLLSGCSYDWGTHTVSNQTGSMRSENFTTALRMNMTGSYDKMNIKRLDVSLSHPFGDSISRYTLLTDHLPGWGRISAEGGTLKIAGTGRGTSLKGSFELGTTKIACPIGKNLLSIPQAAAKGTFSAKLKGPVSVDVSGITITTPESSLSAAAAIRGGTGDLRVAGRLKLKDIHAVTPQGPHALKGLADGSLKVSWDKLVSYEGNISLTDASMPFKDGVVTIEGPLAVKSPQIASDSLRLTSGDTDVTLSGRITLDEEPFFKGNVLVRCMGTDSGGSTLKGLEDYRAEATIRFVDCIFSGLPVQDAQAKAELKKGILSLTDLEVDTVSGTARGAMNLAVNGTSDFDMTLSIKGADMRRLLRATNIKSVVDGTMDLQGRLYGRPDSINGTLVMTAHGGEIRKYALVSQIFSLLNVYKIIQNRDIDILSRHFTYNRISSTLNIRDNMMEFDDFALESNSIQLSAVGKYSLETKRIEAHIGVQPLESVDLTISKIPLVGWVLTDEKGKMIVVNMGLTGTMDEPKVQVEPISTLSDTVAASLLRSLKLPGRLVDESLKLINKKN